MIEHFCDCPSCPCNVPIEQPRRGVKGRVAQRDCDDCEAGRHMRVDCDERTHRFKIGNNFLCQACGEPRESKEHLQS